MVRYMIQKKFKQSCCIIKVYPSEIAKRVAERKDGCGEVSVFSCFPKKKAAHDTTKDIKAT